MKPEIGKLQQKEKFIELRGGAGFSLRRIAKELGLAKSTLSNWDFELQQEIAILRAEQLESLFEKYSLLKEQRIIVLGEILKKIKTEAINRDLTRVPAEKLLELFIKFHNEAKQEVIGLQPSSPAMDKIGTKLDIPTLTSQVADILDRYRSGGVDKEQVGVELEVLESLLKATELANLSERVSALEITLKGRKNL